MASDQKNAQAQAANRPDTERSLRAEENSKPGPLGLIETYVGQGYRKALVFSRGRYDVRMISSQLAGRYPLASTDGPHICPMIVIVEHVKL